MLVTNDATFDSRVQREAEGLARAGFEVTVRALDRKGNSPSIEEAMGFPIIRCREWKAGRWLRCRKTTLIHWCGNFLALLRFLLFALKPQAEIIHAHDLDTLPLACLAALRNRAKVVYDCHEIFTEQWPRSQQTPFFRTLLALLRTLESLLIKRVHATITVSPLIASYLATRYSIPAPIVIRNCSPLAHSDGACFSIRESLNLPSSERILLHVGALVPIGRALRELVLALRHPGLRAHLVFLGSGPMEAELRELVAAEGLQDRVHFLSPVRPSQLIDAMREADLAAVLIKEDGCLSYLYSLPNKLFEAIAAALPVVASDLPEIAYLVRTYDIGVLCNPEDPADIARAIEEALEPARYASFKANLQRAQEDLNWEKESQKLIQLYQGLAPGRA